MINKTFYILGAIAIFCYSCGDEKAAVTTTEVSAEESPTANTIVKQVEEEIEPNPELEKLSKKFSSAELPYSMDDKKLDKIESGKELKGKDVKLLSQTIPTKDLFSDLDY